jgi:hypothetical protein
MNKSAVCGALSFSMAFFVVSSAAGLTDQKIGSSGKTYASNTPICAVHPTLGMAPKVQAGLYNPAKNASANVSMNQKAVAKVTFASPDADVWLAPQLDSVEVALSKTIVDRYQFDATPDANRKNICMPDTSGNQVNGDLEYAASSKSYATVAPGCAMHGTQPQPYVNLFDNGTYLLNVSTNYVPLTQLNGTTRRSTPVFLSPGLNVISAANGSLTTDYYVRDGGTGGCTLP